MEVGAQLVLIGFHLRSEGKRECVWNGVFFIFYFLFGGIDFYVVKRNGETKHFALLSRWIGFFIYLFRFDFIF